MTPLFSTLIDSEDDRSKVEKIWDLHQGLMMGEARRILKDRTLAEDAVQESFIKIIRHAGKFTDISGHETKGYIVSIVRSICYDMLRKAKSGGNKANLEDIAEMIPDGKPDILSKLIFDESYGAVKEAIQDLSYDLRSVVRLFLIDGRSHSEIAETLGITEVASRSRLKRAKKEIRKRLKGGIDGK